MGALVRIWRQGGSNWRSFVEQIFEWTLTVAVWLQHILCQNQICEQALAGCIWGFSRRVLLETGRQVFVTSVWYRLFITRKLIVCTRACLDLTPAVAVVKQATGRHWTGQTASVHVIHRAPQQLWVTLWVVSLTTPTTRQCGHYHGKTGKVREFKPLTPTVAIWVQL